MSCISHGIGGPGAAICFEELIKLGATTIIRLGTCGSLKPEVIRQGDLVVSIAACREDGHSQFMCPQGFPAVADPRIVNELDAEAKELGFKVHTGVTLTQGTFYQGPAVASTLQVNADAGAIAVEMENATLFCIGTVRGIRTAAIATVDGSPFKWDDGDYDPHGSAVADGKINMIKTGLRVGMKIARQTNQNDEERQKVLIEKMKIFPDTLANEYLMIFKDQNLYDYLVSLGELLTNRQRAHIFDMTLIGLVSNLQFYMENMTDLNED